MSKTKLTPGQQMCVAVDAADVEEVQRIIEIHPEELMDYPGFALSWFHYAARLGHINLLEFFLSAGLDVNLYMKEGRDTPLDYAVRGGQIEAAKYLISRGAIPGVSRMLIGAINVKDPKTSFELVKLLVEHGADVNECWRFGDEKHGFLFNALSWAIDSEREDIANYLRTHGAVMPPADDQVPAPASDGDEIVAHFQKHFGPVSRRALREIVPTSDPPIAVHQISPTPDRPSVILFTTGMSRQRMDVPPGEEAYAYAECMIELPAKWPLSGKALATPDHRWPLDWLRKVASYPGPERTWLGGPFVIMANSDPPAQFSPNCRFTSMLLLEDVVSVGPVPMADGRKVMIYRLIPLYEEERLYEQQHGLEELTDRLNDSDVGFMVDIGRPCVV